MNKVTQPKPLPPSASQARPSDEEAEAAVRTLIRWAGDDPDREGRHDTPRRVVQSYLEFYRGRDAEAHL